MIKTLRESFRQSLLRQIDLYNSSITHKQNRSVFYPHKKLLFHFQILENMDNNRRGAVGVDVAVSVKRTKNNTKSATLFKNDYEETGNRRARKSTSSDDDSHMETPANDASTKVNKDALVQQPSPLTDAAPSQNELFSNDKLVVVTDVDSKTENYIRRFERLATFAELVHNKMLELFPILIDQVPTFSYFRSVLQNFVSSDEFRALKAALRQPSTNPSSPPPFPWSPLLRLLSQQYPTMDSVPDFVDEFIRNERYSQQPQNEDAAASSPVASFDEFASFSRRVAAFLLELPPAEHSDGKAIGAKVQATFTDWFHSADANEPMLFFGFMNRNIGTMFQKLGLDFTAPTPPSSFAAFAETASTNDINTEFSEIIHEGDTLKDLICLCEQDTGSKFVRRWRETSGPAKISIVSAKDSLNDPTLARPFTSHITKLVILSGPPGCGKSIAAFTLPQTGVVAYACADPLLQKRDFAGPPNAGNDSYYRDRRNRFAVSILVDALWRCLYPRSEAKPWKVLTGFRRSLAPVTSEHITKLLKVVFGDWSKAQPSDTKLTIVIDEVDMYPVFVRAGVAVSQMFCSTVKKFFKIEGIVHLVAVGTGAENFELYQNMGSTPQSYAIISVKPKNLLFHLLRQEAANFGASSFFSKLFRLLFPNHEKDKNDPIRYVAAVSDAVTHRFLQLASNARCAVLLIRFVQAFAVKDNKINNNTDDDDVMAAEVKDIQLLWRLRAALPLILQQVATAFGSLNGLALLPGELAKSQAIATALGYSLNRVSNLTTEEWNESATTHGLTTDNARVMEFCEEGYTAVVLSDGTTLKNSDGEVYSHRKNMPRYRVAEASVAVLMQRLGIGCELADGFTVKTGTWELLEQLTFDFHCIRSIIPSTSEIDQKFDALFVAQKFVETQNFPLATKQQIELKTTEQKLTRRRAVISRPIWADPHVLFSIKSSRKVDAIFPIQLKIRLEAANISKFERMSFEDSDENSPRTTWRSAITHGFGVILLNAPKAASADVICLAPDRVFMTQCKDITSKNMSLAKILEEFRKMREPEVVSLLRRCCMVDSRKEEDVQVVCTMVLSRRQSAHLWDDGGSKWYETDDLSATNIREFFVAENRDSDSEVVSSFYPFMQSRAAVAVGTALASEDGLSKSQQHRLQTGKSFENDE